jgi:membrane-associated phospholipid phosphatase
MTARMAMGRVLDARAPWTFPRARRLLGPLARTRAARVIAWWAVWIMFLNVIWSEARGSADNVGFPVHGAGLERALFGGLPGTTLQEQVHSLAPSFVEWACVVIYTSWFIVPPLAALFVSIKAPARIGSFFTWWIAVFFVSLLFFVFLPVAPPWMVDSHVQRLASLAVGQIEDNNQLAALPSLHVALPAVLAFWFVRERWNWLAIAMFAYTALIGLEVVVSGEHYIVDVIAGVGVAAAIYGACQVNWRGIFARVREFTIRLRSSESGQAVIEFALIVPLFLVLLLLLFDGGLAISKRVELQHAIREGGRYASLGHSVADVQAKAMAESAGLLTLASQVAVCYPNGTGNAGDPVRVQASYTYDFTIGSGQLISALGVSVPPVTMNPKTEFSLETPASPAPACPP